MFISFKKKNLGSIYCLKFQQPYFKVRPEIYELLALTNLYYNISSKQLMNVFGIVSGDDGHA